MILGHTTTSAPPLRASTMGQPPEVGVGRDDLARGVGQPAAGVEVVEPVAVAGQLGEAGQQVVTVHVGHVHRETQPVGEALHLFGQSGGVEPSGVGHHLDAPIDAGAQHLLHLGEEGVGPPPAGVPLLPLPEDEHGQLGQPVAGQHVDGSALHHLPGRREPVAVEARAVGDAQRGRPSGGRVRRHRRRRGIRSRPRASTTTSTRPVSTWSPSATLTSVTVPAVVAWTACSIFMASSTTSSWPERSRHRPPPPPPGPPRRAWGRGPSPPARCGPATGNRSSSIRAELPSGPSTKTDRPTCSTR